MEDKQRRKQKEKQIPASSMLVADRIYRNHDVIRLAIFFKVIFIFF